MTERRSAPPRRGPRPATAARSAPAAPAGGDQSPPRSRDDRAAGGERPAADAPRATVGRGRFAPGGVPRQDAERGNRSSSASNEDRPRAAYGDRPGRPGPRAAYGDRPGRARADYGRNDNRGPGRPPEGSRGADRPDRGRFSPSADRPDRGRFEQRPDQAPSEAPRSADRPDRGGPSDQPSSEAPRSAERPDRGRFDQHPDQPSSEGPRSAERPARGRFDQRPEGRGRAGTVSRFSSNLRSPERPARGRSGGRPAPSRSNERDQPRPPGGQRRAFSMPSTPGTLQTGGDRKLGERLAYALQVAAEDDLIVDSLTHPFHSYPARTHPATARELVSIVAQAMPERGLLVDPFCGSGTTLVEARAAGLRAIGVDVNPLAVLVARAKTWTAPSRVRARFKTVGHAIGAQVLAAGKQARRASAEPTPLRGPPGFDPNARNRRLAAWFAPHVRRELEEIANQIDDVARQDGEMATVLTAALSAILYKVSSRTSDTNATWVQRNVARGSSVRWFQQRVDLLTAGLDDLAKTPGQPPEIFEADMRALGEQIPAGTVHGVVTSPPYAGTYDYADHQRLRFDFLGLRHRHLDQQEIGARRTLSNNEGAALRWRSELGGAVDTLSTILAPGALAALVIGDSVAGGRAFYALDDVRSVLTGDLELVSWASQSRAMLGGPERYAFGDRPKAEHLVLLRKRHP